MLKNSILAPALAVFLLASMAAAADAAKTKKQQPAALNNLQAPQSGRYDTSGANSASGSSNSHNSINSGSGSAASGGDSQSLSLFKAGNTSLPAGTYAMTNVSTGAAFVVIVDDSGDMRAQDARAMNLVGDKTSRHSRSKRGSNSSSSNQPPYNDGNADYNSASSGNSNGNDNGNANNYDSGSSNYSGGSASSIPTSLPPQPTPASAILPAPTGGHPLLQGANSMTAPSQSSLGGILPGLFNQSTQNGMTPGQQSLPGQLPGGVKGALQQELQRQIMKHAPSIERQVRKYIK